MKTLAIALTALSLLAAPALAANSGNGNTATGYSSSTQGVQQATVTPSSATTVRPTSSRARSFNFSGRLPTEEDFKRSLRR